MPGRSGACQVIPVHDRGVGFECASRAAKSRYQPVAASQLRRSRQGCEGPQNIQVQVSGTLDLSNHAGVPLTR